MSITVVTLPTEGLGYRGGGIYTVSNGNIYIISYSMRSFYAYLVIWKSTNGGTSFTEIETVIEYNIQGQGSGPYAIYSINPMLDANDVIHIYVRTGSGDNLIRYNRFDTDNDSWLDSYDPWPSSGLVGATFRAQMDSNDKIHIVYIYGGTGVRYCNNTSGSWSTPQDVLTANDSIHFVGILIVSSTVIEAFAGCGYNRSLGNYYRNTRTNGTWGTQTNYTNQGEGFPWNSMAYYSSSTKALHGQNTTSYNIWTDLYINDAAIDIDQWNMEDLGWKSSIVCHPITGYLITVWNYKVDNTQYGVFRCEIPGRGIIQPIIFYTGGAVGITFPIIEYNPYHHYAGNTFGVLFANDYWNNLYYVKINVTFTDNNKSAYLKGGCNPEIEWVAVTYDDTILYTLSSCPPAYLRGIANITTNHLVFLRGKLNANSSKSIYLLGQGAQQPPASDVTVGGWVNEVSGSVLYASIDEVDEANDTDYAIKTNTQVNDYFEIACSTFTAGWVPTGDHYIEFRGSGFEGTITVKIELRLSTVVIMSRTQVLTETITGYSFKLTNQEVDSIIDAWNSLTIRVTIMSIA